MQYTIACTNYLIKRSSEEVVCAFTCRTCQIHEEKVKNVEELLRRRELAVKTLEDTYDQRLKNELSKYFFPPLFSVFFHSFTRLSSYHSSFVFIVVLMSTKKKKQQV